MKKTTILITSILIITTLLMPLTAFGESNNSKNISVAFTNDIHSHLDSIKGKGGLARVQTQLNEIKKDNEDTFVLDGGNFSMGTPFQTIFATSASELRMLGNLEYDAVALGNNEYQYGSRNLAKMLNRASKEKSTTKEVKTEYNQEIYAMETTTTFKKSMPEVVCGNVNMESTVEKKNKNNNGKKLQSAWKNYDVQDYTIIEKNGVKMAVIGLVGNQNIEESTVDDVVWSDYIERAKEIVKEIQSNKEANMIVCLTSGDAKDLAKSVSGIDLIINSGTGENIKEPITEGDTTIVGTEGNTAKLGHVTLKKSKGQYKVKSYELINMGDVISKDDVANSQVSEFKSTVNADYMEKYGYYYDEDLASTKEDITDAGNLVSDSFIKEVKKTEKKKYEPVDVAVVSNYSLSSGLKKKAVTAADAYNLCGLGVGANGTSGYPLVTGYLTGKELKKLVEVNATLADKNPKAKLYISGITYSYNKHRLYLNRAYDIKLTNSKGQTEKITNGKLYRVVTGLAEIQNLDKLGDQAAGMLKVTPKDKNGNEITNYNSMILKKGNQEVKEWQAAADYIDNFKNDKIPVRYTKADDRAIDATSFNPLTIFRSPNNIGIILIAIILIIIALLIGLFLLIRQRKYNKRGFGKRVFKTKRKKSKPILRRKNLNLSRKRRRF